MKKNSLFYLTLVQLVYCYEWLSAGWEKISGGKFVSTLPETLGAFASNNPYGWFKNFLLGFSMEHATLLGYLVEYGEIFIGFGLLLGAAGFLFSGKELLIKISIWLSVAANLGGAFLNAIFYLAGGWTSPGTHGVNLIMFFTQLIIAGAIFETGRHYEETKKIDQAIS